MQIVWHQMTAFCVGLSGQFHAPSLVRCTEATQTVSIPPRTHWIQLVLQEDEYCKRFNLTAFKRGPENVFFCFLKHKGWIALPSSICMQRSVVFKLTNKFHQAFSPYSYRLCVSFLSFRLSVRASIYPSIRLFVRQFCCPSFHPPSSCLPVCLPVCVMLSGIGRHECD